MGLEQCVVQSWDHQVNEDNKNKISIFSIRVSLVPVHIGEEFTFQL